MVKTIRIIGAGNVNTNIRRVSRLIVVYSIVSYNKSTTTAKNPANPTKDG